MYQRISAADATRRMPPQSSHKSLTPAQIARLKLWIEQGAAWKEHWAYRAPVKAAPPVVKNAAWARTPIDRFILAKLEAKGLAPAPAADRRTLIRRVALDLTGLPPTPAELDAYLKDLSTRRLTKTNRWTDTSRRRIMARTARATGWTLRATPTTHTASMSITTARSGPIGIG